MKKIIALSSIAFLSTAVFASADMQTQIDELTAKLAKIEKKQNKNTKKLGDVNALAAKDNVKFDVDFRTAVDRISYKSLNGKEYKNDSLLTNRLWLNMGYAPTDNMVFKGQLAVHKAFGANYGQRATGMGFDTFDWVINENLTDETVRLREAYWLYSDTVGGLGVTASVGRRPATNGFLANLRDDDQAKSPMGHVINMEFDGASASVKSDALLPGMMFKLCLGRGLTNAAGWNNQATGMVSPFGFSNDPTPNYAEQSGALDTVDMAGFIFKPYDDGQYSVMTTWYRGFNVPGMIGNMTIDNDGTAFNVTQQWDMKTTGDMDGAAISLKVDGVGDGISDFLDETTLFASYAMSKSHPNERASSMTTMTPAAQAAMGGMTPAQQQAMGSMMAVMKTGAMMGSDDSEKGTSIWVGAQMPNLTGGKFGLEYNKGSENWRSFTYGEDTMIGSKLATRGTAIEAYWTQPLIDDVFSMQVRYTKINYDYTGSNGFFGDGSTSYSMEEVATLNQLFGMMGESYDTIESSQDLRVYFRYRY